MTKMWSGCYSGITNKLADDFDTSLPFDKRMYKEDITGSIAHAKMLAKQGIITEAEKEKIVKGLKDILEEFKNGVPESESAEDIHMLVEEKLTKAIGTVGKKLHTARSRNDQVALDLRLYTKNVFKQVLEEIYNLEDAIITKADKYYDTILPGYTHLERAQPITFGFHLMTYAMMFIRDIERINDALKRVDVSPIGACALAGTTYNTDRVFEADLLGMSRIGENAMDCVSDRDFVLETLSDLSIIMMHLSRLSEEIILWSGWEYKFIELSNEYTTGSSIMPQKKNPDMAELIRGKTGRVMGKLSGMMCTMKALPLAYNKDLQEDKEAFFDSIDTVLMCLPIMTGMINTMSVYKENMRSAGEKGFINATDLADYLVKKGLAFRDAYKTAGSLVHYCLDNGYTLEKLPIEVYKETNPVIEEDVYEAINLDICVAKRTSRGGTAPYEVKRQIAWAKTELNKLKKF